MRFIKEKDKKQIGRLNLFGAGGLLMFNFLIYIIILRRATAASFSSAGQMLSFLFIISLSSARARGIRPLRQAFRSSYRIYT